MARRPQLTERLGSYLTNRSRVGPLLADLRGRAFPDHWSFMLGQVAVHSLILVLISGVFLMFFYDPSMERVVYDGSYVPLQGVEMSRALASTLEISFEVRAGLFMRQVHHWAAHIMIAAIMLHMLRVFFTGAFRAPRKRAWVLVFLVFVVTLATSYTGAVLPDDMLSGTSLAVLDGVLKATPLVGTWLSSLVFGGSFPGDVLELFYPMHVLILPVLLVALFTLHAAIALRNKPAQFAGPGRTDDNVVGRPLPVFAAKSGGYFLMVTGVVALIAGVATVSPVWLYGPAHPGRTSAGAGPEWYLAFMDGALRLVPPGWEFVWLGRTWTLAVLIPVGAATLFLTIVAAYPFLEALITRDRGRHHLLERPRDNPTRTGIGVAGMAFYGVLWAAAGADTIATRFSLSIETVLRGFQVLVILGPVVALLITRRIALGLQRQERDVALHGVETGRIVRLPSGHYVEVREPVDTYERWGAVDQGGSRTEIDHARA